VLLITSEMTYSLHMAGEVLSATQSLTLW